MPQAQSSQHRRTIGYVAPDIHRVSQRQWMGILDAVRQYDLNLICFPGWNLHTPIGFRSQANILYELLSSHVVDGMISWASALGNYADADEVQRFHERYRPLPMVTIGKTLPGFPSLLMSSYDGLYDAMKHLIEHHGYRRIAFVRGPEDHFYAQERFRAYTDALAAYHLPYDPQRVTPPYSWETAMGAEAMRLLLDERKLRPHTDFDAVIAANDHLLLGVLNVLRSRHIHVPDDVALVGFDDIELGRTSTPPFTTVRVPFYDVGYQAVETLLALLEGQSIPESVTISSHLVVRRSCGCLDATVAKAAFREASHSTRGFAATFSDYGEQALDGMKHAIRSSAPGVESDWAESLLSAFSSGISERADDLFLRVFDRILGQAILAQSDILDWHNVISVMQQRLLPCFAGDETVELHNARNLWRQARVMIAEAAQRAQAGREVRTREWSETLRRIGAELITTFDVAALVDVLAQELPHIGIPSCYLALYDDDDIPGEAAPYAYPQAAPEHLRLILAYTDQERIPVEPKGFVYTSHRLVPKEFLPQQRRYSLVVEPLYFQQHHIGCAVFEIGPRNGNLYAALQAEISSALQGDLLVQQVQEHAAQIVRQNTELKRTERELVEYRDHLEELVEERTTDLTRSNERLHHEIMERRRAEHALGLSEQQYRTLADHILNGIVILQENRVVFANAAFADMIGHPLPQVLQQDPALFFPESARSMALKHLENFSNPAESSWQTELFTADSQVIWAEIEQTTLHWNNQPAILLTIQNITQRKLREQQLEQERVRLQQENLTFKSMSPDRFRFGSLVGKSSPMQRIYDLILSAAISDVNVLIVGESGTGKELIARTLHQVSPRKSEAFVAVNCASVPETLFEREFFGHRRGTFTGADRDKPGLFDRAHKGILFLDEVTELSPGTQAKLLRVLQDGEYFPLGSTRAKQANVSIIAATNKDCREEMAAGRLRKDFFYRIGVIEINVPPLRERKDDLPLLVEHILEQYRRKQLDVHGRLPDNMPTDHSMLPGDLVLALYDYGWPGNVRELQNVLQRYLVTRDPASVLALIATPIKHRALSEIEVDPEGIHLPEILHDVERQIIADMLAQNFHRASLAAPKLGIPLRTLQRKIKQYGLLPGK